MGFDSEAQLHSCRSCWGSVFVAWHRLERRSALGAGEEIAAKKAKGKPLVMGGLPRLSRRPRSTAASLLILSRARQGADALHLAHAGAVPRRAAAVRVGRDDLLHALINNAVRSA